MDLLYNHRHTVIYPNGQQTSYSKFKYYIYGILVPFLPFLIICSNIFIHKHSKDYGLVNKN